MALNTTIGHPEADSYCTVAEADNYLTDSSIYTDVSGWTSLSESAKEERLRLATRLKDTTFFWVRHPVYENQARGWPRWTQVQADDFEDEPFTITIPVDIKKAEAYIAWDIVHRGLVNRSSPTEGKPGAEIQRLSFFE